MDKRSLLHDTLTFILGTPHVYFQPPESLRLEYPCIVYRLDNLAADYADDKKYSHSTRYQVTVIDRDPDSQLKHAIFDLPKCQFDRHFATEGLNHDVFILYY